MSNSKQYIWIDYAKFFSIFLVVYFHCLPPLNGIPALCLQLLRIPCFFFLSGFLFRFEKYPTFIHFVKHRSKQLLIPYFCFFFLFYAYWLIIGRKTGPDIHAPLYQPFVEYIYGRPNLVCTPLWFVSCLFALQCIFYLLCYFVKRRAFIVIILFTTPLIPLFFNLSKAPWMLNDVCLDLPFYGIACLFKREIMTYLDNKKYLYVHAFIMLLIFVGIVIYLPHLENQFLIQYLRIFSSFCVLFPVLMVMRYLSDLFGRINLIEYISVNAIIVLAFHAYLIRIFILIAGSEAYFDGKYVLKLLMAIFILFSMTIPIYLINKYTPFMLGKGSLVLRKA